MIGPWYFHLNIIMFIYALFFPGTFFLKGTVTFNFKHGYFLLLSL